MTAEIAIMNRSAVAIAADSAVTMRIGRREKIFPSANKIFSLSVSEPVGVMVYGQADFMGVPWETVIKVMRDRLKNRSFRRLRDYARWFRSAIANSSDLIIGTAQAEFIRQYLFGYFDKVHRDANRLIESHIEKHKDIKPSQAARIYYHVIGQHRQHWMKCRLRPDMNVSRCNGIRGVLKTHIDFVIKEVFEKLPIPRDIRHDIQFICESLFVRESREYVPSDSGLVIAGFGNKDILPALSIMGIVGCLKGTLLWTRDHNLDMKDERGGVIVPFAQTDEVHNFLDGVHPDYRVRLENDFTAILDKATELVLEEVKGISSKEKSRARAVTRSKLAAEFEEYKKALDVFRRKTYSHPILQVLEGTPKDQLAAMAESLVSLTSFKRRVSTDSETVGGPIDVAVISKGDGFVWVKRKHYFPADLNPQFFVRYNRESK